MTPSTETPSNAGRVWAWVPALLLGATLLGLGTLAYIAIDDPHFALEPNYYDKAVHWDTARAEARENEVLGLKIALSAPLVVAADGRLDIALSVQTRRDLPLSGAVLELEAFPNAYASRVQHISLRETAPGAYAGALSQAVRGLWELRIVVKQGSLRYSRVLRVDVTKAGAA